MNKIRIVNSPNWDKNWCNEDNFWVKRKNRKKITKNFL